MGLAELIAQSDTREREEKRSAWKANKEMKRAWDCVKGLRNG